MNTVTEATALDQDMDLDALLMQLRMLKRDKENLDEKIAKTEAGILALAEEKTEGSVTIKTKMYKATVTYKVYRKLDADQLAKDWHTLPTEVQEAVKWKPEVSVTQYRKLEGDHLKAYQAYLTTTPAKPSIKVEAV